MSVYTDGDRPPHASFLLEQSPNRLAPAALASALSHVTLALMAILLVRSSQPGGAIAAAVRDRSADKIVWLKDAGPGGGGGGGGNQMNEPPRQAEMRGRDEISVPVAQPRAIDVSLTREPDPVQQLMIPAKPMAAALDSFPGSIEAPAAPPTQSQGSGTGGGAGTGVDNGDGPGRGDGLGPGSDRNTGGGPFRSGTPGLTLPRVLREVKPQYTADAMRAKVQGMVLLACVVRADGTVGQVRVIRSLDPTFGLDQQAIAAAKLWRFAPGTRFGEPVAVQITIELTFTIR